MKTKNRLSASVLYLLTVVFCVVGLTACGGDGECSHQWGEWTATTNASCTEAGVQKRECSECGETETSAIDALGHDWNEATCSTPKTCKACSATEGLANAHAYTVETVKDESLKSAANCTSAAVYYKSCSCGAISTNDADSFISGTALEHKDENTDHACDNNCGKNDMGTHTDSATDADHVCDYGCGATIESCSDAERDGDHSCNVCGKPDVSAHNYSTATAEAPASCFECGACKSSDGLAYTLIGNGSSYSVSQGTCTDAYVYIPDTYNGLPVTNIANRGFLNNLNLISIKLPSSITVIEDEAFSYCSNLISIVIPNGVTSISNGVFSYCHKLANIVMHENITSIGKMAFWECKALTSIEIPSAVTSIENYTFHACTNLTSIILPNGITSIGIAAFANCFSLTDFVIPSTVESIGAGAFRDCRSLTSITIPECVSSIGEHAFVGNVALTTYCEAQSKPDGWNSKWNALAEYLSDDTCPVVWNCKNNDLADDGYIYVVTNGIRYGIKDGAATVVKQPTTIKTGEILSSITYNSINYNVTSISAVAFEECANLTDLEIPNTLTSISRSLFGECTSLKYNEYGNALYLGNNDNPYLALIKAKSTDILSCEIHESTKMIAAKAFLNCTALTSIDVPSGVEFIGDEAFSSCTGLTKIVIPKSVKLIGNNAIYSRAIAYCESEAQPGEWHTRWNPNGIAVWGYTYVFADGIMYGIKDEEATVVRQHKSIQEANILSSIYCNGVSYPVTKIGDEAFASCVNLTGIEIPYGVTSIGNNAFIRCTGLLNIELADSVMSIGELAFFECTGLTKIVISQSVQFIGLCAFANTSQNLTVYCEAASKPDGWDNRWKLLNTSGGAIVNVVWGYTEE